jgi:hypothetical protein
LRRRIYPREQLTGEMAASVVYARGKPFTARGSANALSAWRRSAAAHRSDPVAGRLGVLIGGIAWPPPWLTHFTHKLAFAAQMRSLCSGVRVMDAFSFVFSLFGLAGFLSQTWF